MDQLFIGFYNLWTVNHRQTYNREPILFSQDYFLDWNK